MKLVSQHQAAPRLAEILNSGDKLCVTADKDVLVIEYANMYEAPPLVGVEQGKQLQELFGCADVLLNNGFYNQRGCESCDWGSNYGHEITIVKPTKNADLVGVIVQDN